MLLGDVMKKQISTILSIGLCVLVLLTYQNCGTESATGGSLFAKSSEYPPPYDIKINQIAYMSCSEQKDVPNPDGVFFTFRVGAYGDDAGIRLNDDFLYAARREDKFDKRDILGSDNLTLMTRLQLSMRQPGLLTRMFVNADSNEGTEGVDFDYVFGEFGSDEMSAAIINLLPGEYMNYWAAGGINRDAYFSGTLVFNGAETLANDVRTKLESNNAWALTFGFSDPTDPVSLRTVDDYVGESYGVEADGGGYNGGSSGGGSNGSSGGSSSGGGTTSTVASADEGYTSSAFGVGLRVSFRQPNSATWVPNTVTYKSMPQRVLEKVSDFNLDNPSSTNAQWSCPTSLQLMIVHPDDVWNTDGSVKSTNPCPVVHDSENPSEVVKIIRRSLPASDWFVNPVARCAIPRNAVAGSCYGIDQGLQIRRTPTYGINAKCNPAINASGVGVCAHFISICVRP
jgi:hypothetical protein